MHLTCAARGQTGRASQCATGCCMHGNPAHSVDLCASDGEQHIFGPSRRLRHAKARLQTSREGNFDPLKRPGLNKRLAHTRRLLLRFAEAQWSTPHEIYAFSYDCRLLYVTDFASDKWWRVCKRIAGSRQAAVGPALCCHSSCGRAFLLTALCSSLRGLVSEGRCHEVRLSSGGILHHEGNPLGAWR